MHLDDWRHSSHPVQSVTPSLAGISLHTQIFEIATNATERQPIDARKGALAVPERPTNHSAKIPAQIATRLLSIVIALKMPPSTGLVSSSISWLNSATSQLSNTLHSRVPQIPPSTRPRNRIRMSSARRVKLENEYSTQYARHAVLRP